MSNDAFKQAAKELVDQLPDTAGWDDLIYRAVVRRNIEAGLADSAADRVLSPDQVLAEFDPDRRR